MNTTQLIGRLGKDPKITHIADGVVANMSIATKEFWRDASGAPVEHTEWHQVVCYDRFAALAENLVSGDEVWLEGNLRTKRWVDEKGNKHRSTQLRVTSMRMLRQAPDKDRIHHAINTLASIAGTLRNPPEGFHWSHAEIAVMVDVAREKLAGEF